MKQLVIVSGKGGTGKTTVAGAFLKLSGAKAYADCDVDAPNLHLIIHHPVEPARMDYYGMPKAVINPEVCTACGRCAQNCRFHAILPDEGKYRVDPYACEGCGVCTAVCCVGAVGLRPSVSGFLQLYSDSLGVFSTAQLKTGAGATGLLVTQVKRLMRGNVKPGTTFAVADGSPGIGCPVIASLNGADLALIVTEPSLSGLSDLARIVKTAETLRVQTAVCVNKYDIDPGITEKIRSFCDANELPFVGCIPFDPEAVAAVNAGETIVERDCPSGTAVREVFQNTMRLLETALV